MIRKKNFVLLMFAFFGTNLRSQTLTVGEVISWPRIDVEMVNENLIKKGWEQFGYEINKDSGFVRRTWMIKNNYNDLKSYFQYYQSDADTIENYIIYQFSDRVAFNSYKTDLKKMEYKLLKEKRKKKKKEKNKYNDKEELFLADKRSSLISIKEVFLLGFNTFLVTSYNSRSRVAKSIFED